MVEQDGRAGSGRARVAIACQGGGSHTAFTAGVLSRLLQPDAQSQVEVTGISGTSGGAICALLAWSALVDGDPSAAEQRLRGFWADNSARSPGEAFVNAFVQWSAAAADYIAFPALSPYQNPGADAAERLLRSLIDQHVDVADLNRRAVALGDGAPHLLLGAVDVLSGAFKAFDSRQGEISTDAVLASAAIPTLFRSIDVDGRKYWDGLFSQNPPIRDLLDDHPDEVWVIQINPSARDDEPESVAAIADRRNELAGNLSLYQELAFIERIDRLVEQGVITDPRYKRMTVRVLEMERPRSSRQRGYASKLNRSPAFLDELVALGVRQAEEFLVARRFEDAWASGDAATMLSFFADDCEVSTAAPFRTLAPTRSRAAVADLVTERIRTAVAIDFTRKQIARETVSWRVRATSPDTGEVRSGLAEVTFTGDKVTRFTLGPVR